RSRLVCECQKSSLIVSSVDKERAQRSGRTTGARPVIVVSVDILYLLDQLEEVLGGGSRLPLTSRTLVDEQEILDILDQIRVSIPDELKAARRLTQERDQVLADARAEAERILVDAEAHIAERIAEHNVVRLAEQRAADVQE